MKEAGRLCRAQEARVHRWLEGPYLSQEYQPVAQPDHQIEESQLRGQDMSKNPQLSIQGL